MGRSRGRKIGGKPKRKSKGDKLSGFQHLKRAVIRKEKGARPKRPRGLY